MLLLSYLNSVKELYCYAVFHRFFFLMSIRVNCKYRSVIISIKLLQSCVVYTVNTFTRLLPYAILHKTDNLHWSSETEGFQWLTRLRDSTTLSSTTITFQIVLQSVRVLLLKKFRL